MRNDPIKRRPVRDECESPSMASLESTASAGTLWTSVFGEALTNVSSPGARRRNRKLHALTPEGTHLDVESSAWLSRHQEKAQSRLERKVERKMVQLRKPPKADGAATGNVGRLQCLVSGSQRMPSDAHDQQPGNSPQQKPWTVSSRRGWVRCWCMHRHTSYWGCIACGESVRHVFSL